MTQGTVMYPYLTSYTTIVPTAKQQIAKQAQTLYANRRAVDRQLVPWRNASKAVKREFQREARQILGYE